MKMRLNKFLADSGVASRRAADELIARGAVVVDGQRAALGDSIDPTKVSVTVGGRRIHNDAFRDQLTLILNKPPGVITTMHDDRGRKTVADFLPNERRLFPVGRLDAQTTGLLLCTTDGALARWLMHPSSEVPKRYDVVARGTMNAAVAASLGASDVRRTPDGAHRFSITLTEGKNRQVRRACARHGLRVVSLERTQFGPLRLGKLKIGCTRTLTPSEARELERLRAEGSSE